jgi:polyhydroxyalkanoate synthesis regulator phasin
MSWVNFHLGLSADELKKINDEVQRINKMSFEERNNHIQEVMESLCRDTTQTLGMSEDDLKRVNSKIERINKMSSEELNKSIQEVMELLSRPPSPKVSTPAPKVTPKPNPAPEPPKNEVEKAPAETKNERVNHPTHYNTGKFEVIDVIEDWRLGFNLGNVVKYVARAEHKGNSQDDLEKALWYIQREIDLRKSRTSTKS